MSDGLKMPKLGVNWEEFKKRQQKKKEQKMLKHILRVSGVKVGKKENKNG